MADVTWLLFAIACTGTGPDGVDTGEDTDTDGPDDTDTGAEGCPVPIVTFTPDGSAPQDVTSFFETGDYLTLALPGVLDVCPGTWFAHTVLRADVTVRGLGAAPEDTVLSGGESGTIVDVAGPNVSVTVANLTLDRGAGLDVAHNSGGGGVYCEQDGVVVVEDVRFTNNFANDGAGLYTQECDVTERSSRFVDNISEDDGGAITFWYSTATLQDVTVTDNRALDGGAMAVFNTDLTIDGAEITDNAGGQFAGGIWGFESTLVLRDVALERNVNSSTTQYGGGLIVYGSALLESVAFVGNEARRGGGLYVYPGSTVDGIDCDFSTNDPEDVYAANSTSGQSYDYGAGVSFSCADNRCEEL